MHHFVAALLLPLFVATYPPFQAFSSVPSRYFLFRHHKSSAFFPTLRNALPFAMRQNGVTGDLCNSRRDCKADRQCLDVLNNVPTACEAGDKLCFCVPFQFSTCSSDADCDKGEVCAILLPDAENPTQEQVCISPLGLAFLPGLVPLVQPGQPGTALSFESCTRDEQCLAPRVCNIQICVFEDLSEMGCFTDDECETDGEVCAEIPGTGFLCVSEVVVIRDGQRDPSPLPTPVQSPTPSKSVSAPTTAPTAGAGSVISPTPSSLPPASSPAPSTLPDTPTTPSPESIPDAGTLTVTPKPTPPSPITTLESLQPSPTTASPFASQEGVLEAGDASTPVCIDAKALTHLPAAQLVFDKHSLAPVLCDDQDSCATPGHIVRFQGTAMRMSSYCRLAPCVRKAMHVNSPRYSRGLLIKSNTDGLDFTVFAARYNTRIEEIVLTVAVHVGL